jgi:hypothetical protein
MAKNVSRASEIAGPAFLVFWRSPIYTAIGMH